MILDEGFRGINRYRVQDYLHLLAKSYDKFEEKERNTLSLARKVEKILKMSNKKDDKHKILEEIQKLQKHINADIKRGDSENHPILEILLAEIQELNRNLSLKKDKKKRKKKAKLRKDIENTPFKDDKELSAILERIDKLKEEDILKN